MSRRQLRRHLGSPTARLRVLEHAGTVGGYALLFTHARRRSWRMYSIILDPGLRGLGLGRYLLADAIALARKAGAQALVLEVREDNPTARALYRRQGFVERGFRPGYYEDGCTAVRMRLELGGG